MFKKISLSTIAFAAATPAFAHLNPAEHGSFMAGLSHPFTGLDHILAMVSVGLWAAMIGGKAKIAVPAAFVTTMAVGFALALYGVALPFVEPAIMASIVALGLLVAMAVRFPLGASAAVVAVFALFHGYAHGSELGAAGAMQFGLGFVAATILLHAAGVGLGVALGRYENVARFLGAGTAVAGLALMLG
ncbi:HupE/UreJ family protein [Rhizobium sp. L1K21]|uniref:HupE/UreJ family protein n=1 Tax=Rhizobium sp. L1K21 TaxID=2954933 RepID=UPI0020928F73|nr:HupE/UreJ family protein [Rhizobium sp. L1K21]MCO6185398.1 HupE/UreJ family protein [Rhizobium sp. L1K21]